jgi:hypothetical protein
MSVTEGPEVLDYQTPEEFELAAQVEETNARWAPYPYSNCHFCRHLATAGAMTCTAFPGGIPWEIQAGEWDHRQPHPGDHGIRYDPLTPEEFRQRAAALRGRGRALARRGAAD